MGDEGNGDYSRLCPACTGVCYRSKPLWDWDDDAVDTIILRGKLHLLHSDIDHFYHRFQQQARAQTRSRKSAVSDFRLSAHILWPSCQVHLYGSSATGLFLSSSDVDLLILNTGCSDTLSALETLAHHFLCSFRGRISSLKILKNATVPIIRFHDSQSMLYFDVRCECSSMAPPELRTVQLIKNSLVKFPAIGPLYVLLKMFLHERNLDKLYRKGGVRPYMLFIMLYTFLHLTQLYMEPCIDESPNLALLLLGFLHFYGTAFKSERYGISCRDAEVWPQKCFFFSKTREVHKCGSCPIVERLGFYNPSYPDILAVEDPLNPSNDLGKNSRNYPAIQGAFLEAYLVLMSPASQMLRSLIPATLAEYGNLVSSRAG